MLLQLSRSSQKQKRKRVSAKAKLNPIYEKSILGPSTLDETDSASESESKALFEPYLELITWDLDKQKDVSLLDDDSTVYQQNMPLLLQ